MKQTFLFLMLYISTLGFSQRSNTAEALIIDTPIDNIDVLPQPVVTNSNVTVASSNLKVNNTAISGSTVNLATQSSTISFNCLLTTLDGSINNTFGNLYVYFKESATSSPIMVNYFQSVTFLPPTVNQTNYTSSLLNQSFLLNKSDFYNTGGLFYIEYKNNNNLTFRSQNYNVTGGTKTIIVTPPPGSADFNIQEIKYSDGFPIVNNQIIIPVRRGSLGNTRLIDITISSSFNHGSNTSNENAELEIYIKKPNTEKQLLARKYIAPNNGLNTINNISIDATGGIPIGSHIFVRQTFLNIYKDKSPNTIVSSFPPIEGNKIEDHKFITSGQSVSFLNQNIASLSTGIRPQIIITQIQTYKWQYKIENTNTWIDFSNQTSANLTNSGAITQNMLVRRVAFHNNGHYSISNSISVSVNAPVLTNTICCNQIMVSGNVPQNFIGNSAITNSTENYKWESMFIEGVGIETNPTWGANVNTKDYIFNPRGLQNRNGIQTKILYRRLIVENEIVKSISNEVSLTIINSARIGNLNKEENVLKTNNETSIILFPNPTKDNLNIELPNINYKNLSIVNILGEIVKESTINNQKNIIIDMSNYTSGVYFLILEDTLGTKQTRKIIKE